MKKARNFRVGRREAAALFGLVVALATAVAGRSASAQEERAIPAAVETERSGRATLGVDASELDFYNDYNDPPPAAPGQIGTVGQVAPTAGTGRNASTGEVGQPAQGGQVAPTAGTGRNASTGEIGQPAQGGQVAPAAGTGRNASTGEIGQPAQGGQVAPTAVAGRNASTGEIGKAAANSGNLTGEIEFEDDGKSSWAAQGPRGWFGREGISASLKTILTFSILAVAPAILLATTSFVRISVVLTLLRQGIGAGQVPSNQTIAALAVFLSLLIMAPVWSEVYEVAVVPYANGEISDAEALQRGQAPVRTFLWRQIEKTGNAETIGVFTQFIPGKENPEFYEDVPWRALAPAFLLSELKTAFLIGFQILIPFLIIDVVVSSVLVSTGMMMLPPTVVSLPFKLALFVLSDGWTLVVKSLLESFAWGATG